MGIDVFMANYYRAKLHTKLPLLVWSGLACAVDIPDHARPRSNNARSNFRGLIYYAYCSLVLGISGTNGLESVFSVGSQGSGHLGHSTTLQELSPSSVDVSYLGYLEPRCIYIQAGEIAWLDV